MKDWNKLTTEELATLTDKQVEFYKKLICAQNGIEIPVEPKEVNVPIFPKDIIVYRIDNLSNDIYFKSLKEAVSVSNLLKQCCSIGHYEYERSYSDRYFVEGTPKDYTGNNKEFTISAEDMYSRERFFEIQEHLKTANELQEKYYTDKKTYIELSNKVDEAIKDFVDKLEYARNTIAFRNKLTFKYYNEYLPLAENNKDIAMGFLEKVYVLSDEDKDFVLSHNVSDENVTNV